MVKLDNWETKAEKAAERRMVAKKRKKQRDRTRSNKSLGQRLLSFLDGAVATHSSSSSSSAGAGTGTGPGGGTGDGPGAGADSNSITTPFQTAAAGGGAFGGSFGCDIHIWTDTPPSGTNGDGDGDGDDGGGGDDEELEKEFCEDGAEASSLPLDALTDADGTPDASLRKFGGGRGGDCGDIKRAASPSSTGDPESTTGGKPRSNSMVCPSEGRNAASSLTENPSSSQRLTKDGKGRRPRSNSDSATTTTTRRSSGGPPPSSVGRSNFQPSLATPRGRQHAGAGCYPPHTWCGGGPICADFFFTGSCRKIERGGSCTTTLAKNRRRITAKRDLSHPPGRGCSSGRHPSRGETTTIAPGMAMTCSTTGMDDRPAATTHHGTAGGARHEDCEDGLNATTLHDVLRLKRYQAEQAIFFGPASNHRRISECLDATRKAAEAAMAINPDDNRSVATEVNTNRMGPVHHILLRSIDEMDGNGVKTKRLSDQVVSILNRQGCCTGSIVYLAVNGILVFDRYRNGIVLSDLERDFLLFGNQGSKRRSVSIGGGEAQETDEQAAPVSQGASDPSWNCLNGEFRSCLASNTAASILRHHQRLVQYLPAPVLEYILTFLPDEATSILPKVCTRWHKEIGRSSPNLWRYLLQRRKWPSRTATSSSDDDERRTAVSAIDAAAVNDPSPIEGERDRHQFLSLYGAVRTAKALARGLKMMDGNKKLAWHPDVALLPATAMQDRDVGDIVKMWSPCRVLVASKKECCLKLYDIVESKNGHRRLKQVVCHKVGPGQFRGSKRFVCSLVAVDLDEDTVGCLFRCGNDNDEEMRFHAIPRETLLCTSAAGGSSLDEQAISCFNLNDLIQDYFYGKMYTETLEWVPATRVNFCHVSQVHDSVACGGGNFLLKATLWQSVETPPAASVVGANGSHGDINIAAIVVHNDGLAAMDEEDLIVQRFFLFSVSRGDIVWSDTVMTVWESNAGYKTGATSGRMEVAVTSLAIYSPFSQRLCNINVDGDGHVNCLELGKKNSNERAGYLQLTLNVISASQDDIIIVESYRLRETSSFVETEFSFYSSGQSWNKITSFKVHGMYKESAVFGNDHLLVFLEGNNSEAPIGDDEERTDEDEQNLPMTLYVINLPSRTMIHQVETGALSPALSMASQATNVTLCAQGLGLLSVDKNMSSALQQSEQKTAIEKASRSAAKRKKKSSKRKSNSGIDGFARGMRLN